MAKVTSESKFIASVYPGQLWTIIKYVGPSSDPNFKQFATRYTLKPVPRHGKVKFDALEVSDAYERVLNAEALGVSGRRVYDTRIVPCADIVENLLQEWAAGFVNVPNGLGPGIMEIANTTPTQVEMTAMLERQTAFFQFQFSEGERLHRDNQWKEITPVMRLAAEWLGPEYDRTWASPAAVGSTIDCPSCAETIKAAAIVCKHCGLRIKALPSALAALNPDKELSTV